MFHHKHSATVGVAWVHSAFVVGVVSVHSSILFVVGIVCVIRELSACGGRFPHLLSALFFVVVEFSAIPAFGRVLMTRTGVEAPPSCEGSLLASILWPKFGVVVVGQTSTALSLAESASRSSASSSSVRVRVEHVAIRLIAPCTHVVFFDQ